MTSALVAALAALLTWAFVEVAGRTYPSRQTWRRLRIRGGFRSVRKFRERIEAAAASSAPRVLAQVLIGLVIVWLAAASLLDKRWWEVALDLTPHVIVAVVLLRVPSVLTRIAQRMKDHERDAGFDPDEEYPGDAGPAAIAL